MRVLGQSSPYRPPYVDIVAVRLLGNSEECCCMGRQGKSKEHGTIQFDYFFLTQGANDEFLQLDHIYPEEFPNILEASDHIPIVLELGNEMSLSRFIDQAEMIKFF